MQEPAKPSDLRIAAVAAANDGALFPRIPGYRFLQRLGQGGMATVYLAMQESLDRPVSIKVMEREALEDEVSRQRFEHEARTIAKLSHPCIVSIYEVGRTADQRMYYIMPYLPNGDLSQRDLRQDEARIVDVLHALLSALGYAHARGIVHRDVKEENVLFDAADRPLLTDFGIALSKRDTSRITTAGLAVGSSGYMAPEQARGDEVDGRADLYSVGVLAYELVTGELPYHSTDALALALMHAQKAIPRLPAPKRHWQGFIDRAMAKAPEQRFRNAQQMLNALDRIGLRTGSDFANRARRHFDRAKEVAFWRQPRMLALGGVLLLAIGLYGARDQLPSFGASAGSMHSRAIAATAASPKTTAPANIASVKPPAASTPAAPLVSKPLPTVTADPQVAATAAVQPATPGASPITPDAAVLGAARDALAHANLTAPADSNAVSLAQMAWKLSPAAPDTKKLAADVLAALAKQQALAIGQHRDQRVLDYQQKALQLADATVGRTDPAWRALHASAAAALDRRVQQESGASDSAAALKRTETLAGKLDLSDAYTHAIATAQTQPAEPATSAAPDVGAGFVLLHGASKGRPAAAVSRSEVTRHEYAQFVNATRRPASQCESRKAAAVAGARKNWTEPGFTQESDQPVVCVSWNDANAYVQWLNSHNAQRYRLPSAADLRDASASATPAAIEGGFSNWLQDCAAGCERHMVVGRSWHERGPSTPATNPAERGFDDVGFRVVRDLGGNK